MKLRTMLGGSLMVALGALALVAFCGSDAAQAGGERKRATATADADYPKARYYRKRTRVYGYTARRGGYSYRPEDVINTYGLTRNLYGSMNSYRDPYARPAEPAAVRSITASSSIPGSARAAASHPTCTEPTADLRDSVTACRASRAIPSLLWPRVAAQSEGTLRDPFEGRRACHRDRRPHFWPPLALLAAGMATPASAACKKFSFLVNDYGKDGPTKDAKDLLDKYIAEWMKERGITKCTVGKKDVTCELYPQLHRRRRAHLQGDGQRLLGRTTSRRRRPPRQSHRRTDAAVSRWSGRWRRVDCPLRCPGPRPRARARRPHPAHPTSTGARRAAA